MSTNLIVTFFALAVGLIAIVTILLEIKDYLNDKKRMGELLVTGSGDIVIDDIPLFDNMILRPHKHIDVFFLDKEPQASCNIDGPDNVTWTMIHTHKHLKNGLCKRRLRLKIVWSVNTTRTIRWCIDTRH